MTTTNKPATPAPPEIGAMLRRTARGGLLNLFGAAVAGAGGLIIAWLAAVGLGPDAAGQFFAASSAFLLAVALARLGTPTGLVYWVARARHENRLGDLRVILPAALLPAGVLSILVAAVGMVAAEPAARWHGGDTVAYVDMLRLLAVFLPFAVATDALLSATRGFGGMRASVLVDKLGRTGAQLILLAAVVWWWQAGPLSVTMAWVLPFAPAALAAALWLGRLRRNLPADTELTAPWTDITRRFWVYTAPRALAGVAQLLLQRLDILLVAGLLGFAEAAIYTVATRFVAVGQLISGAIGTAVQPRLATSMSQSDYPTARTLYQTTTGWIVATNWPLYLVVALAAPWYLRVFGEEYATPQAIAVVWVLAAGMLLATACGVVDSVLVMAGRTGWQLYNVAAAVVVNLAVDLWLIPRIGILGAAIGWTAAIAVNNLMPLAQLWNGFGLHPFGRGANTAMALSLLWCGLLPALAGMAGEPALVAGLIIGTGGYLYSAWRIRKTLIRPANP